MPQPFVLVTGATGFLGRHLIDRLATEPLKILPLVRDPNLGRDPQAWKALPWSKNSSLLPPLEGSVLNSESWKNDPRLEGLAGIIHLAAIVRHSRQNKEEVYRFNVTGT
ncbi:MAG: SDR family oxidoreductase, partial [bacterium]|nr:SDR family oxidoreductase [bacterium]